MRSKSSYVYLIKVIFFFKEKSSEKKSDEVSKRVRKV